VNEILSAFLNPTVAEKIALSEDTPFGALYEIEVNRRGITDSIASLNQSEYLIKNGSAMLIKEVSKISPCLYRIKAEITSYSFIGLLILSLKCNDLKKIDLSNNALGNNPEFFGFLCKKLEENKTILSINLSRNSLGDNQESMKYLFEALKVNSTLTSINLKENSLENNDSMDKRIII